MTKQELQEELEASQWRAKQVYTKREKNTLAQVARIKAQAYLESSKCTTQPTRKHKFQKIKPYANVP